MGAGIMGEEEIDAGSTLANKWIEVKERCPYFFLLRDLLDERSNVTEPARANSKTQLDLNCLKRFNPKPTESPVQQLELGFLDDVISLSNSIKHGEEEANLDEFMHPSREEVEIIRYKRKSDVEKGADFTSEGKKGHRTGIVPKIGSKHDRGKLPISKLRPSWTTEVKKIVNTLLDQPSSSSRQDNHSNRCLCSSSYSKKYPKLTDQEEDCTTQSSDHHQQAWLQLQLEKLAVERNRMRHKRDMMILKFRLEHGDQLADIENM
ncbi:hypothetical protein B9Z19DRAFT_1135783 [Tuber borchii]|uniref:Uncharacterized protein n=1 Tax=Tuber borchii TaxID=42251 RepID=A0A2T6ZCD2_TUBBO|nr:hypothetical protein B9Z19DRAFT_1135783 [Tuber borchii]